MNVAAIIDEESDPPGWKQKALSWVAAKFPKTAAVLPMNGSELKKWFFAYNFSSLCTHAGWAMVLVPTFGVVKTLKIILAGFVSIFTGIFNVLLAIGKFLVTCFGALKAMV